MSKMPGLLVSGKRLSRSQRGGRDSDASQLRSSARSVVPGDLPEEPVDRLEERLGDLGRERVPDRVLRAVGRPGPDAARRTSPRSPSRRRSGIPPSSRIQRSEYRARMPRPPEPVAGSRGGQRQLVDRRQLVAGRPPDPGRFGHRQRPAAARFRLGAIGSGIASRAPLPDSPTPPPRLVGERDVAERDERLAAEDPVEVLAGRRVADAGDLLRRPLGDDPPAPEPAGRPEVDDPVGGLDDVEVVLDDEDGVALVDEPVEDLEELLDVGEVEPGRRLVEEVEGPAGRPPAQLGRELDPLRLAARQRRGRLAEVDVAETDLGQDARASRPRWGPRRRPRSPPRSSSRGRRRSSGPCSGSRAPRGCSACPCTPRTGRRRRRGTASRS